MKLWEAVEEIFVNEDDVYRTMNPDGSYYELRVSERPPSLVCNFVTNTGEKENAIKIPFRGNWEKVKQPVTWQEAIQAWSAGRVVSVEVGGCKFKLTHDDSIFGLSERMINLGTWYVED